VSEHQLQTQSLYDDLTANVSGAEYSNDSSVTMTQQRERRREWERERQTDTERDGGLWHNNRYSKIRRKSRRPLWRPDRA